MYQIDSSPNNEASLLSLFQILNSQINLWKARAGHVPYISTWSNTLTVRISVLDKHLLNYLSEKKSCLPRAHHFTETSRWQKSVKIKMAYDKEDVFGVWWNMLVNTRTKPIKIYLMSILTLEENTDNFLGLGRTIFSLKEKLTVQWVPNQPLFHAWKKCKNTLAKGL